MIEPYYVDEQANITLYQGDVLRILPLLRAFEVLPDKVMTITDPPYNVGMDYGAGYDDNRDLSEYAAWTYEWWEAAPQPMLVTPGAVNLEMWLTLVAYPTAIIPWIKPNQSSPSKLGGFNAWEAILLYGKLPRRLGHDAFVMSIGPQAEVQGRNGKKHPCPKYLPFWTKFIGNVWADPYVIFDPFAGSGTTLLACKRLGIPCIGIELQPHYCDLIVERLQQEVIAMPEVGVDESVNFRMQQQALAWEAV